MRIGILGSGNMADALGTQWARAGHDVMVSGRDPGRAAALADRMGARTGTWREAADFGDVVLLAIRDHAVFDVLREAGPLDGRVLIDVTNSLAPGFRLKEPAGTSFAERVAAAVPRARVVKAFNLCHEDVWRMTPPAFDGAPLAVPLAGDDADALAMVETLVRDMGCEPVSAGPLDRAGLLEAAAALVIGLWLGGADARAILPPVEYASGAPARR
ncbi:NADPH-dependent F420 reductase [Bailinhaonella thermotolerans]|uniref:NADP oxidoreductase n=1 Tax=Bailinhaonella thermotolerans TaxID=1070861 RepID=A0A3A4ASZ3_9ACTN|nr:NAD(P)-binding domain-containing protein [Bailinhaonella thermotolerans]RJL22597.1 NADP oxidoreductase [Bailinhaonella thermotolerans]